MSNVIEEPSGEESGERHSTSLTVTQPDSQSVTDGQQNSSDENEPSSSSQSTSENENGDSSSEASSSSGSSNMTSSYSFGSSFEEDIRTIHNVFGPETSHIPTSSSLKTFKLIGDN